MNTSALDIDSLEDELNMDNDLEPFESEPDQRDPETIIRDNISKANHLLNRCISEVNRGNFSARVIEVAGKLVNEVTNASSTILGNAIDFEDLQLKKEGMKLKKAEVTAKINQNQTINNNNLIVTDRESLLKLLGEQSTNQPKLVGDV